MKYRSEVVGSASNKHLGAFLQIFDLQSFIRFKNRGKYISPIFSW